MATSKHDSYPVKPFKDSELFIKWLEKNHSLSEGIWIKIAKASSGIKSITYSEALDEALCYGWIDGLCRGLDEKYFLQKFTPRTKKSIWSVINKKKVAALIKAGKMRPAGIAVINAAKKDGRWKNAYESPKNISVPADLQEALNGNKKAKAFFTTLKSQNRYAILFRITQAKRPETRMKKIEHFIRMLEKQETIYPQ